MTFLGHVGFFVETDGGSVLCDPWFNPAYFGSWFPFPRNDTLDVAPFSAPDYLYVSHLHRDHFDPAFLTRFVDKRARVLLPDFPAPFLRQALEACGFRHFVETRDGVPLDLDGLDVTILAMSAPADGPLGDSAIVIADASARVLNQNDARPGDPGVLQQYGPYDAHIVQFSGAIWYPIVYDFAPEERDRLAREKRVNQMARSRQYIEWVKAANVFPAAGPPCFLDADLFALNDLTGDPANIFPDQSVFLDELRAAGIDTARLIVPGSVIELEPDVCRVTHPAGDAEVMRPFTDKAAYLREYRADWSAWIDDEHDRWSRARAPIDLVAELAQWFEPLLANAPITSAGVAGLVVLDPGADDAIAVDFVESEVRPWRGEPFVYKADVDRVLLTTLVGEHTEDWVNSLFLSCRFRAHRPGPFNEYVMTFFKALSPERIAYVEQCYRQGRKADEFFERDGWRIERWCPHRQADLTRFGDIEAGVLTCSLHHWQFDLETGRCLTSDDRHLRCERSTEDRNGT
ncbi:MAG: Rieske 2Fe-2S domain-containing protein [Actinomycetota bacterium]|nr:Rieske 2Fe-2S domain-containing protein [Actinomycetota bacterium]